MRVLRDKVTIPDRQRFNGLDVLRGIAVLAVVLLHSLDHARGRGVPLFDEFLWPILRHGYLGVQLFFVISGYCIIGAIDSAMRAPKPIATYIKRRLRRIYPPYWLSLFLAIGLGLLTSAVMKRSWNEIFPLTAKDWLLNILLLQGPFSAPNAVMVYWSLTIEVQFYFLMVLCLIFSRWRSAWLVGLSAAYATWVLRPFYPIYGTPLAFWPEFACGIAAYIAHHPGGFVRGTQWWLWGLSFISALIGLIHVTDLMAEDGAFATPIKQLFCLGCGLMVWRIRDFDWIVDRSRILGLLSTLGIFSYSSYLIHVPIGTRVFNLAGKFALLDGTCFYLVAVVAISIQFASGWLFYRYCEYPWLNQKRVADELRANNLVSMAEPVEALVR